MGDLLRAVKQLIDVLKHSEDDITKKVNESSQVRKLISDERYQYYVKKCLILHCSVIKIMHVHDCTTEF